MLNEEQKQFVLENYPNMGKMWCCEKLGVKESEVRVFASFSGLRINRNGFHFKDFQNRAALSKIGKKRPDHSVLMKNLCKSGLLKQMGPKDKKARENLSIKTKAWIKEKGHPKGMLGKKHTDEAKKITSISAINMWKNPESKVNSEKNKLNRSITATININKRLKDKPESIYSRSKKGKIEIGGKVFFARSSWEANIACYFQFLKEKGQIKDWLHEPETFWFLSIKRGVRSYLPDFKIINNDDTFYFEEVKGWMDAKSKTKLNRMRIYYPNIEVRVLDQKRYNDIKKNKLLFSGWGIID